MKVTDEQFIQLWDKYQSPARLAEATGMAVRAIYNRRTRIEKKLGIALHAESPTGAKNERFYYRHHMARADASLENGQIFVASDCHYWPGEISTAHKAFVKLIKKHKPSIIVMNGDVFDGATISRYPKMSFDGIKQPTVKEEIETVAERLHEIEKVAGNAKLVWTIGNHDMRYEARLAQMSPEYEGVKGFNLREHFPRWTHVLSLMVNENLMIKHRTNKGGVHATWNNVIHSGSINIVTGHLHRLQATIFSNYRGTFWGVDTGTLSEIDGDHMIYGEDNPKNHCSGFAVLNVVDGQLVQPEFCYALNGKAYFRGNKV